MSEVFDELKQFDDVHLQLLNRMIYDSWNWDSGSAKEKELLDAIEVELQERNMGNGGIEWDQDFYSGNSYQQFDNPYPNSVRIGAGTNGDLVIKSNKGITYNKNELIIGTPGGTIEFGYDLEMEVRRMSREEICIMGPETREAIKKVVEQTINDKIKEVMGIT